MQRSHQQISLPDGQIHIIARLPNTINISLTGVSLPFTVRNPSGVLTREIQARRRTESKLAQPVLKNRTRLLIEVLPEGVEVDITGLSDGLNEVHNAVALRPPIFPHLLPHGEVTVTINLHRPRELICHQTNGSNKRLESRTGGITPHDRPVEEWLMRVFRRQEIVVIMRHASHPHGGIVVGIGGQGQNLSISRIQGDYSRGTGFFEPPRMSPVQPFLNGLFYRCLQICINRQNQVPAGNRLHHAPYTLRSTYSINLNLPRATFTPEKRVIRSLHTVLSHTLAGVESPELLSLQLLGWDLTDMPKNVCAELSTQIIAEIGLTYCHPGKLEAMFLEIRHHRHLGHILLDDDFPVGIILPLIQLAPDVFFGDAQDIGKPADNNSFILQIHGKYRHTQTGSILHQRLPVPVVNNPPSGLNLYLSHPVVHCKHLVALT